MVSGSALSANKDTSLAWFWRVCQNLVEILSNLLMGLVHVKPVRIVHESHLLPEVVTWFTACFNPPRSTVINCGIPRIFAFYTVACYVEHVVF
jgi:hypothetical protein